MQRVEPLELVAVQVLLDVEPEGQLWPCGGGETTRVRINKWIEPTSASAGRAEDKDNRESAGMIQQKNCENAVNLLKMSMQANARLC